MLGSWYLHVLAHAERLHRLPGVLKLQSGFQSDHRVLPCKLGCKRRDGVTARTKTEANAPVWRR